MSATATKTATYTTVDVENVVRRVKADLTMIGDSTGSWTPTEAANFGHDIEILAKNGYLSYVDVTLLSGSREVKAVCFNVDADSGSLTSSRPGGVLWPRVENPRLRVLLGYTDNYDTAARQAMRDKMRFTWTTSFDDTSHSSLTGGAERNYTSNSYGMKRKDWGN